MRARRFGMLAALAVSACGPGPILLVDMDVPMPAQRLLIYGTSGAQPISFQGRAGHTPLDVDGALRRLTLELPKDTTVTVSFPAGFPSAELKHGIIALIERAVTFWHPSQRH